MDQYSLAIARGLVEDLEPEHKFGENPLVSSANAETVWDGSTVGRYPFNSVNQSMEVLSDDDADTLLGTGAQTLFVQGQNLLGVVLDETIDMDGQTPVLLANQYLISYRSYVVLSGSNETNVGNITIRIASGGATQAVILAENGQTLMAIWRIPGDSEGFMSEWAFRMTKKVPAITEFTLFARLSGESWRVRDRGSVNSTGTSSDCIKYDPPKYFPPLTEIYVFASTDGQDVGAGSSFDIRLVKTAAVKRAVAIDAQLSRN